ncbi:MAG: recombinase RecT [Candidatus Pacebacteria bacterium]|nr:recombinase RecT [Candidatus Paceibacterota bacterium]
MPIHPIIEALQNEPYKYNIEQLDEDDITQYRYLCTDGIYLLIHTKKPSMVWAGETESGERVTRNSFTKEAEKIAGTFIRDYNIIKMEIGTEVVANPEVKTHKSSEPVKHTEPVKPAIKPTPVNAKEVDHKEPETKLVTTEKALAPTAKKSGFYFTERQIEAMKVTVAKGASQAEFEMFIYLATKYKLDPFLKEIFFIPGNMKTILTSRDGYLKVAQSHKDFEGIRSMAVRANDDFEIDLENDTVKHKFGKGERGPVIGGWAIVYRKGRRPVIAYADLCEYQGNTGPWKKYVSAMICKCAEAFALKRQFAISGLVTMEEMDVEAPEIIDPEYVMRVDMDETEYIDAEFEEVA